MPPKLEIEGKIHRPEAVLEFDQSSHPQLNGGVLLSPDEAYVEQQAAVSDLPDYDVTVSRRTTHKNLGSTEYADFSLECIRFDDGAIRLLTRAQPKISYFGAHGISPYGLSGGDALFTGPDGMNAELIDNYAKLGFPVVWLHHQGRHTPWPTNPDRLKTLAHFLSSKSVGKSAHHDHAMLDDLEQKGAVDFDTYVMIRDGFSRSAMSGEAFIALAGLNKRTIVHSDLTAKCFALYPGLKNIIELATIQGPEEIKGLGRVACNLFQRERAGEKGILKKYLGTFDPHILNILHELAWIPPLINGDNGVYSRAIPLDTAGVRGFLSKDTMSQYEEHEIIHANHPNLALIVEDGAHVDGAIVQQKIERYARVRRFLQEHDMSILGMRPEDYLDNYGEFELAS